MKVCSICKNKKSVTEFHKSIKNKSGLRGECKLCQNEYNENWRRANPEKAKSSQLKTRYGITLSEKQQMIENQKGKCALCSVDLIDLKKTHLDHCHITKKIRGILCQHCNHMLGHAKDNIQTLKNAVQYLSIHKP